MAGQVVDQWTRPNPVEGAKPKRIRTDRWGRGKRWLARWDENGRRVSKAFENKDAAEAYLSRTNTEQVDGTYVEKAKKDVTVAEVWPTWWAGKLSKATSTKEGYQAAWKHIEPRWGTVECQKVTRPAIAAWIPTLTSRRKDEGGNRLPLGESAGRQVMIVLNGIMETAVEERIILANPVKMKDAPKQKASERRYLSVAELDRLEAALPTADARMVVDVLVRTGLRPGEAFGLQVGDLDAMRGRLRVSRDVDATGEPDETKTRRHRDVPVGGDLLLDLENLAEGRARDEWLLGGWTRDKWRPVWAKAIAKAGLWGLDTYELRHTAASLAIHSGANVKTVQRMLGHASAAMTLDIYGHLWDDELDSLPSAMDAHMKAERQRFADRRARADGQQSGSSTGS